MFESCDSEGKETKVSELQVNISTVYYDVESILFHLPIFRLGDCGNCGPCMNKTTLGVSEKNRCILKSKCLIQSNGSFTCDGEYVLPRERGTRQRDKEEDDKTHHIVSSDASGTFFIIQS